MVRDHVAGEGAGKLDERRLLKSCNNLSKNMI